MLLGSVTHYYAKIDVAEITAIGEVAVGDEFVIIGETSGVVEGKVEAIHLDSGQTQSVKAGDVFSIKVSSRVRRNDKFFIMKPVSEPLQKGSAS